MKEVVVERLNPRVRNAPRRQLDDAISGGPLVRPDHRVGHPARQLRQRARSGGSHNTLAGELERKCPARLLGPNRLRRSNTAFAVTTLVYETKLDQGAFGIRDQTLLGHEVRHTEKRKLRWPTGSTTDQSDG